MSEDDEYLTRSEVAKLLRVTPRCVAGIEGLEPLVINPRLIRYKREQVEVWLEERRMSR